MASNPVTIAKGRVARTTKANAARNLPEGVWAVVTSDGLYDKAGSTGRSKLMDVVFYVTREDAWEESAFLLGKRSGEMAAVTDRRRGRSVGGGITEGLSLTICGNMGIGRV